MVNSDGHVEAGDDCVKCECDHDKVKNVLSDEITEPKESTV